MLLSKCASSRTEPISLESKARENKHHRRRWPNPALLVLALIAIPTPLLAQARIQDQIDFQRAQSDALLSGGQSTSAAPTRFGVFSMSRLNQEPDQPFSFNGTVPFHYSGQDSDKSGVSTGASFAPEGKFGFGTQPWGGPVRLSGYVDVSLNRYITFNGSLTPSDTLSGAIRADLVGTTDKPEILAPYVLYAPTGAFSPLFAQQTSFTHDLTVGVNTAWEYKNGFKPADPNSATAFKGWAVSLQSALQHRFDYGLSASNAVLLVPAIKFTSQSGWGASFQANLTERFYDPSARGSAENDFSVQPIAVLSYQLASLFGFDDATAKRYGKAEIDFQAAYANQSSNVAAAVYQRWSFGPTLTFGWKF
jgi:hypothetical protein